MSKFNSDFILRLPIEVLEAIADLGDQATDVLALRLTCRILAAAAFRSFTNTYIAELWCFILDQERLQRVINILNQQHLFAKVKKVHLMLEAHEQRDWHPLAANDGERYVHATKRDMYAKDEYDRVECPENGISEHAWTMIRHIMVRLGQQNRSSVVLDLYSEESVHWRIAPQKPDLPARLLDLALATRCRVSGYHISNSFEANVADFMALQKFEGILQNMETFALICKSACFGDLNLENPKRRQQYDLVRLASQNAPHLKDFRLIVNPGSWPIREEYLKVSKYLLS